MVPRPPASAAPAGDSLPPRAALLVLGLCAALLLFRLGALPLTGPDEPRYARVAAEMARQGELVTPTLQGRPWLEKPVLYYWLAGASFALFGETDAATRIPSVLASLLLVGSTALFGARLYGRAAGLHAGFVLATSVLPFAFGHAASMDMLLAACVSVATGLAGLRLLGIAGRLAVPVAWAFAGLATLAKGPIGLALPVLVVFGYVVLTREWRWLRTMAAPAGLLVFIAIAGPWYAAVTAEQGRAFVDVFLLDHNLARFTSTIHHHPGSPLYYLPVLLLGLAPWTGLLLPGLTLVRPRRQRADLFVLLWLLLPLIFLSAAGSKLPGYVLPCLPPLALLMGRAADSLVKGASVPRGTGAVAVAVVTGILAVSLLVAALWLRSDNDPSWLALYPLALWTVLAAGAFATRAARDPAAALAVLRVGAAGLLVLCALAAPPLLDAQHSGRSLFEPARGEDVLAWRAWRTAWVAGYWYNDGRVREVATEAEVLRQAQGGSVLVLCGPQQREALEGRPDLRVRRLASGPRGHTLLRVSALRPPAAPLPGTS